jgi:phosphoglucosamine mutase
MKALFGTDGIRGEAGSFPLDATTVSLIGFLLVRFLRENESDPLSIVLGRDTRESGTWLAEALIKGLTTAGAECHSAGVITTPGVAFLTRSLKADAGIVISASHNPYHDNGIKIFSPSGKKLDDSIEHRIEAAIFGGFKPRPAATAVTSATVNPGAEKDLQFKYLSYLAGEIGRGLSLEGLKIVVDCANGASFQLAPMLFQRLGANVIAINAEPDGRNINLNCGSLHIEGLQERVKAEKADLGVAFDGDADRALFVDNKGAFVDGDATMWVLANYLKDRGQLRKNTVVATVMSNIGLEIALQSRGISLERTDVGDKYVLDALLKLGTSLGGEQSGHIILPDLSLAGDGIITALCLLRAQQESASSLAELTEGCQRYPQVLVNVRVREKPVLSEIPSVHEVIRSVEEKLFNKGRLLLRYSGTEPLARVMIEGEKQAEIEGYAASIAASIQHAIGV